MLIASSKPLNRNSGNSKRSSTKRGSHNPLSFAPDEDLEVKRQFACWVTSTNETLAGGGILFDSRQDLVHASDEIAFSSRFEAELWIIGLQPRLPVSATRSFRYVQSWFSHSDSRGRALVHKVC